MQGTEVIQDRGAPNAPLQAGLARRDGPDGMTLSRSGETTSAALAEQARTVVLARIHAAKSFPRDLLDVRHRVLNECKRPRFAEVARYSMPRAGKQIEGFSIRFAEACARNMGNISTECPVIFEDDEKRIVRVIVTDLETNATYSADVTVTKVMERRKADPKDVIGSRKNSSGDMVYLVPCTDADLAQKQNNLISRAARTLILRLVPGDILDEALEEIEATFAAKDKEDPAAAQKHIADAFAALGVMPSALKELLGHELGASSPAELKKLRGVYAGIRDGVTTWAEVLAEHRAEATAPAAEGAPKPSTKADNLRANVKDAKARASKDAPTHDPSTGEVAPEHEPKD